MANTEQKPEKELKQVNFRVDPDTANAFREFCTLNGMNQAQGFDHVMQVLELNSAKTVCAGRAVEIEDFEQHTKALLSSYLKSLELCDRAETRARERFDGELKQNARTIADLNRQNEELRASLLKSQADQTEAEKRNEEYKDRLLYSDRALAEQNQSMQILKEQVEQMRAQVEDQKQVQAELSALRSEKEGLAARASVAISQAERLNEEITSLRKEKNKLDATLKEQEADVLRLTDESERLKKALAKAEGEKVAADSLLKSMETDKKNEMERAALQAQLEKERAVAAKEKELQKEMMALRQESMRLSAELDYIKQHGNHQAAW